MEPTTRLALLFFYLFFFATAFSQAPQRPPAGAEQAWEAVAAFGNDAMEKADYANAERAFRQSLSIAEQGHLDASFVGGSNDAIGWVLRSQRRYREAEPFYRAALQQRRSFYPEDHFRVVQSKLGLGMTLIGLEQNEEAEKLFLEVLTLAEHKPGAIACDLIEPLDALTSLYRATHQYEKGERVFVDTFAILTRNQSTPCEGYIGLLEDLASLYTEANQWEKVDKVNDGAIQLALGMEGANSELYGDTIRNKAESLYQRKQYAEAASHFNHAATVYRRTEPPSLDKLASALERQEFALFQAGRKDDSERVHQQLLAVLAESDASSPSGPMLRLRTKAMEAQKAQNPRDAEFYAARAIEVSLKMTPADQMVAYETAAGIHSQNNKLVEAEAERKKVLEIAMASTGASSRATANAHFLLGTFYMARKRYAEAEQSLASALLVYDDRDANLKMTLQLLTSAYLAENKYEEALPVSNRSVHLAEVTHDELSWSYAMNQLAHAYQKARRYSDAENTYQQTMTAAEKLQGTNRVLWAEGAMGLASLYRETARLQLAEQMYLQIVTFFEQRGGKDSPALRIPLDQLIDLLKSQGRLTDAAQYESRRDKLPALPPLPGSPN